MTALVGMEVGADLSGQLGGQLGGQNETGTHTGAQIKGTAVFGPVGNAQSASKGVFTGGAGEQAFRASWQLIASSWGAGTSAGSEAQNEETGEANLATEKSGALESGGRFVADPEPSSAMSASIPSQATPRAIAKDVAASAADTDLETDPHAESKSSSWNSARNSEAKSGEATSSVTVQVSSASVNRPANKSKQNETAQATSSGPESAALLTALPIHAPLPVKAMPVLAGRQQAESELGPSLQFASMSAAQDMPFEAGSLAATASAQISAAAGITQPSIVAAVRSRVASGRTEVSQRGERQEGAETAEEIDSTQDSQSSGSKQIALLDVREAAFEAAPHVPLTAGMQAESGNKTGTVNSVAHHENGWKNSGSTRNSSGTGADSNAPVAGSTGTVPMSEPSRAYASPQESVHQPGQMAMHGSTQPVNAAAEGAAMVRDPGPMHAATNSTTGLSSGQDTIHAGTARETFSVLDTDSGVGTPGWVHAGGRSAEAGFEDPQLGWVGVRADLSGGGVHAALVPGSAAAAESLSEHLAGLNSYLTEQHTPVATLTMASPLASGAADAMGQSTGQSMDRGTGQNAEQNTAADAQQSMQTSRSAIADSHGTGAASAIRGFDSVAQINDHRGMHISVMA